MFSLQDQDIQNFLREATLMGPRFKGRLEVVEAWNRLGKAVNDNATAAQLCTDCSTLCPSIPMLQFL